MRANTIQNQDCIRGMKKLSSESVDLVVTSPPYNIGMPYESWDDNLSLSDYISFSRAWLQQVFRVLKKTGRIALHLPYAANMRGGGGRVVMLSLYWEILQKLGFRLAGLIDLHESCPHISRLTAWGSWLSASAPYICCPKECVLIAFRGAWNRGKGKSYFKNSAEHKREFIELVSGVWKYQPQTAGQTPAAFGIDIPLKALKLLSYENDLVLDPFMGSGTTALACLKLNRRFLGYETCKAYWKIACERVIIERLGRDNSEPR